MSEGGVTISRRAVLVGLTASAATAGWAEPLARSPIPPARPGAAVRAVSADRLIASAQLTGKLSYVVADARTGAVIEAKNPLLRLPPASTAKAITSAYALDRLGPGHRFRTQLVASGAVSNGRLSGDLVLLGGGDPVLSTDDLGDLAAALKRAGIREITGRFLFDDRCLPALRSIDPEQPDHVGYNPAISGLNLNFNRVHFEWKQAGAGWTVTMDARAERYRPQVTSARMRVVARDLPVYTYSDRRGVDDWTVASGALGKGGARWLPVRNPGAYAAEVFQTLARAHGIVLPRPERGATPAGAAVLAVHDSPPLSEILQDMLKYSTNLTAEAVGLAASAAAGAKPQSLRGSAGQMQAWLGAGSARFVDHSGLGGASDISSGDMVQALVRFGARGQVHRLMKEIPQRDANGNKITGSPVTIRAKTGTLNFVSGLAGYVSAPGDTELAFAIFAADEPRRNALAPDERERPEGARSWTRRARELQMQLIDRWLTLYSA